MIQNDGVTQVPQAFPKIVGHRMKSLSQHEAYAAMFAFLENRYRLTASGDLGALLGSMSLLPGGGTADPAIWQDWLDAIKEAESGGVKVNMKLK